MRRLVHRRSKRVRHGPAQRMKMTIVKGDAVRVITGDDKGKEGLVMRVDRKRGRVVVQGVRLVKKHKKAMRENEESGIVEFEAPIDASNVMLIDPKSKEPTRVRKQRDADGTIERISVKSGQSVTRSR